MKSLPANVNEYKRTKTFVTGNIPAALLKEHQTLKDVWGKIVITKGELLYVIKEGGEFVLNSEKFGVVEPQRIHYVKPLGEVEFHVEFYR